MGGTQSTFQLAFQIFSLAKSPRKSRDNLTKIKELRFKLARCVLPPVVQSATGYTKLTSQIQSKHPGPTALSLMK
jgi:hypothetical protein